MSGYDKAEAGVTGYRTYHWYRERPGADAATTGPVLTTAYQKLGFSDDVVGDGEFVATYVSITNDEGTNDIFVSWDGITNHWRVKKGETRLFPYMRERFIYLKGQAGGETYRVSAW